MKIGFVPIDNRPVCYTLPKLITEIDENIELFLPDREWLGDLTKYANTEKIFDWLKNLPKLDAIVLSLDTVAYGGLISSRRCTDTYEEIKEKIEKLKEILSEKNAKIYAFSSIMRISNNNINEEEKEYWAQYGKKIFNYSYCIDKFGTMCKKEVPDEILEDYLQTRNRNFEINKIYLEWQKEGFFQTLVFSKDDCAEYGFNVQEAKALEKLGGFVKTGADEIPLSLLSRAIQGEIKIAPIFLEPKYKNLISNYEDVSIEKSVLGQIDLAGCKVTDMDSADILLFINNFIDHQGEIVMQVNTEPFDGIWQTPSKPYMIADVRFANGADNNLVKQFEKFDKNFYGYSAWNTSANTLGSLICGAKIKFLAQKYNQDAFDRLQTTRLLDDWAYQANIRQTKPNLQQLKSEMQKYENKVAKLINKEYNINYKLPWNRLFEVEIEFN
ncbi:MAG: DUF4127 family protein [Cyanobacteria bacterium SIG32]|nr:DUF4127 family protein [Cyanobacteria bacterium SIG32]